MKQYNQQRNTDQKTREIKQQQQQQQHTVE
jgi:hypothetical protein